jgi:hypothetical protein
MCVMLVMIVQFPVVHFPARSSLYAVFQLVVKRVRKQKGDDDVDEEQSPTRLQEPGAFDGGDTDELSVSDNELDDGQRPGARWLVFVFSSSGGGGSGGGGGWRWWLRPVVVAAAQW